MTDSVKSTSEDVYGRTSTSFSTALIDAFTFMRNNPDSLEEKPMDMLERLKDHSDSSGQGSANDPTPHEACIAVVFENYGIRLAPIRNSVPSEDGYYFWYQPGGTQQKGDFLLFDVSDGKRMKSVLVDAKHTNGNSFYLNDGWFWDGIVYVVSFCRNVRRGVWANECMIALGQDIPTEKDKEIWNSYNDAKKVMNANRKEREPDFLQPYFRFAHQYSCKQFDSEFIATRFASVASSLVPSV